MPDSLIPWARPDYWGREREYVAQALESTWISGGPFIDKFETELGSYLGVPHAVTAANGTAALHLALLALDVGAGDEIIVPGFAFMAVANVALHLGATPVFADVDPASWCMSASSIERLLTSKTRLIVPVHTYGNVCEMDEILGLANSRGIAVIEDVAEAFGSRYRGQQAGTLGVMGSFSFHATKTITTGEGGLVVTSDAALYDRLTLYRSHGMRRSKRWYWHEVIGHNFRLTNLQAALGCAQLEQIERILAARKRIHEEYRQLLSDTPGLTLQDFGTNVEPVLWAIGLRLDLKAYTQGRDEVLRQLLEAGIEARPGFYAASLMPHLYHCRGIPESEELSRTVLSLPSFASLSPDQIGYICSTLIGLRK